MQTNEPEPPPPGDYQHDGVRMIGTTRLREVGLLLRDLHVDPPADMDQVESESLGLPKKCDEPAWHPSSDPQMRARQRASAHQSADFVLGLIHGGELPAEAKYVDGTIGMYVSIVKKCDAADAADPTPAAKKQKKHKKRGK